MNGNPEYNMSPSPSLLKRPIGLHCPPKEPFIHDDTCMSFDGNSPDQGRYILTEIKGKVHKIQRHLLHEHSRQNDQTGLGSSGNHNEHTRDNQTCTLSS